jgi:hypothetical protein
MERPSPLDCTKDSEVITGRSSTGSFLRQAHLIFAKSYGKAKAINDSALVVSPTMPPPVAIMTTYCFPSRP